jgi:aspartate oxidase
MRDNDNQKVSDVNEWHRLGNTLSDYLGICRCQRKLMAIYRILTSIKDKCISNNWEELTYDELLICALLEQKNIITHGTNCEYPIVNSAHPIWKFLEDEKDNENLVNN